jgi:hypothetical protein
MSKKKIISCLVSGLLTLPYIAVCGGENPSLGARSFGLAHASVTLEDEWSLFNNIAGINRVRKTSSILSFQNLYGIPELSRIGFGMIHPFKPVTAGVSFYRYGDSYYNEIKTGLGVAHKIRNVSLGIKVNYHQVSIQEIGVKRNLVFEFGGITEISKQLHVGAHIYNFNQAKFSKKDKEYIPVIVKAGISYTPYEKISINIESEKQLDFKPVFKTGIEYSIIEKIKLRAGISINPSANFFGAGFKNKNFSLDYAFNTHNALGFSHQISITYILKNKNEK